MIFFIHMICLANKTMNDLSNWEYFVKYILPVFTPISVIVGGAFALYKYYQSKNYERNLRILQNVYAPLFAYFAKQETFRHIAIPESNYKEFPIMDIKERKVKKTLNDKGLSITADVSSVCGCSRDELIKICKEVDVSLAPAELFTLLNSYQMSMYFTSGNIDNREKIKASIYQTKLENLLRDNVISGYRQLQRKLNHFQHFKDHLFKIKKDHIEFINSVTEEEIQHLQNEMDKNPNKYHQ